MSRIWKITKFTRGKATTSDSDHLRAPSCGFVFSSDDPRNGTAGGGEFGAPEIAATPPSVTQVRERAREGKVRAMRCRARFGYPVAGLRSCCKPQMAFNNPRTFPALSFRLISFRAALFNLNKITNSRAVRLRHRSEFSRFARRRFANGECRGLLRAGNRAEKDQNFPVR